MSADQIAKLHQQMERGLRHDWLRDHPTAELADTLKTWATDHNVALPAPHPPIAGTEQYASPEL
jgi:hypothetical protein